MNGTSPSHAATGGSLRDERNDPLCYERASSALNAPGTDPWQVGALASGFAAIRKRRKINDAERRRTRSNIEKSRQQHPQTPDGRAIKKFAANAPLADLLTLYDYEQSPRNPEDCCSSHQTRDSSATRIIDGEGVSLSQSNAASGLGQPMAAGCFGDAYDLFVHYEHGGDHSVAFRHLYRERQLAKGGPVRMALRQPAQVSAGGLA